MKRLVTILLILISESVLFSQVQTQADTLFFDADWKICTKAKAFFYRITEPQNDGGYLIKDMYLKANTPRRIAFSTTYEPPTLEGKCTYYYSNGNKEKEGRYVNNIPTGIWITWSKNGTDSTFQDGISEARKSNYIWPEPYLYDPKNPFSFALRGKVATFFIIEDTYFLTYTLGGEFWYKKHSIGVDGTWFRWRYETDNADDVGMYSQYELRRYLHLDYKFTFVSFERAQLDVYVNLYDKIGRYKMWYKPYEDYDYGTADMTFLNSTGRGTFNEPGLGLGLRKYISDTGFGFDVSANIGYRFSETNERNYLSQTQTDFKDHVKAERLLFYMRVNAFFIFQK
jgi:hypothetical protein